jgi:hypothetical protein
MGNIHHIRAFSTQMCLVAIQWRECPNTKASKCQDNQEWLRRCIWVFLAQVALKLVKQER